MREIIRIRGAASPSRPPGARVADGTGDLGQALGRHLHRGYREIGVPERRIESPWPRPMPKMAANDRRNNAAGRSHGMPLPTDEREPADREGPRRGT
jgi:hypothetical protein